MSPVAEYPADEAEFVNLARGDVLDHQRCPSFIDDCVEALETEKGHMREQSRPLAAVDERVILSDGERVGGTLLGQFRLADVAPAINRSPEGEIDRTLVA